MGIFDIFDKLVHKRNEQLSWGWLPDDNLGAEINRSNFEARQNYFVVRLAEMFLKDERVLWKKYYPMVHAFVDHGERHGTAVAGPGQLKDLGSTNLERLVGLAYPLSDVLVYEGVDLDVLVGLYAVESQDAAKVLLSSLGQLSGLVGLGAEVALQIADVVKTGVEGVLQLNGTTLQLGARQSFTPGVGAGKQAKAGCLLAVNAPSGSVDYSKLWVKEGRLLKGPNPMAATAYADHDYMLIEIERRETREDWASLPEIQKHEPDIDKVLRSGKKKEEMLVDINALWPGILLDVRGSKSLTDPDKVRVLANLKADIQQKMSDVGGGFELRSLAARAGLPKSDAVFDLLDVPDIFVGKTQAEVTALGRDVDRAFA